MIQLFEEFSADDTFTFTTELTWDRSGLERGHAYATVYKPAEPMNLKEGTITWEIKLTPKKRGLAIEDIKVVSLDIILEHEETEEEHSYKCTADDLDPFKCSYELNHFPLYLRDFELTMNGSEEPKDWEISLTIGGTDDE